MKKTIFFLSFLLIGLSASAQGPKVLVITAHPDDESSISVAMFKIAKELKGTVDMAVMTDGAGGFADAQLGAMYYGINLTDSVVARTHISIIRKQEILNVAKILGVRNIYFMEQPDDLYSTNYEPYLYGKNWDISYIEKRLDKLLAEREYDFIITMSPRTGQHGHHITSVIMGLRAVERYKGSKKPIIIAGASKMNGNADPVLTGIPGIDISKINTNVPPFRLNRAYRFAENDKLSYKIVADWTIAEYKSQGAIQENAMHRTDEELYFYYEINPLNGTEKVKKLFEDLSKSGFLPAPTKK